VAKRRQKLLPDRVPDVIRAKHHRIRTEQASFGWIRRFIFHHNERHPEEMGAEGIEGYLVP